LTVLASCFAREVRSVFSFGFSKVLAVSAKWHFLQRFDCLQFLLFYAIVKYSKKEFNFVNIFYCKEKGSLQEYFSTFQNCREKGLNNGLCNGLEQGFGTRVYTTVWNKGLYKGLCNGYTRVYATVYTRVYTRVYATVIQGFMQRFIQEFIQGFMQRFLQRFIQGLYNPDV